MDRASEPYLACFGVEVCVEIIYKHWPNAHSHSQFGLENKIFASTLVSASSIWRRPGLGLVNLALKNVLSNAKQYWLYPFRGCIIANGTVYAVKLSEYKKVVRHCNL